MSSSIRDPASNLFWLLVAIASTGCGFVLGDIPDNPVFDAETNDASTQDDAPHDVVSGPDVSQPGDAPPDRGAGPDDARTNDIAPQDIVTRDVAGRDTSVDRSSAMDSSVKDAVSDPVSEVDPCDMDHDGFRSDRCMGGTDCDDTTDQVYPGEPNYRDVPTHGNAGGGFDYDCSGRPDPEFTEAVNCSGLSLLLCPDVTKKTFLGTTTPACGESGSFGHCAKDSVSCFPQVEEPNKVMRCK